MEMYNPFVPASRTTTTPAPVPEEDVLESWALVTSLALLCVIVIVVLTTGCIVYRKRFPCYRGRSTSLPSIEFDVDEVLAAIEREKSMGTRELPLPQDRVIMNDDEEQDVETLEEYVRPSVPSIPEVPKSVPKKPRRHVTKEPIRPRKARQDVNEARVIDEPENETDYVEPSVVVDTEPENVDRENVDNLQTSKHRDGARGVTEDALDKIKRSNFPKVLPDFPFSGMEFEGNSTHEKRIVPQSPNAPRKTFVPPSLPKVTGFLSPTREKRRNTVPNFLDLHSNLTEKQKRLNESRRRREELMKNKSDNAERSKNPKRQQKPKNYLAQTFEADILQPPAGRMQTFQRTPENSDTLSIESGIYFAEPVNVTDSLSESIENITDSIENISEFLENERKSNEEGNASSTKKGFSTVSNFLEQERQPNTASSDLPSKGKHESANLVSKEIVSLISSAIDPLHQMRDTSEMSENIDEPQSKSKTIPAKLSKARLKFCGELERVLQKQMFGKEISLANKSELHKLMVMENSKQSERSESSPDHEDETSGTISPPIQYQNNEPAESLERDKSDVNEEDTITEVSLTDSRQLPPEVSSPNKSLSPDLRPGEEMSPEPSTMISTSYTQELDISKGSAGPLPKSTCIEDETPETLEEDREDIKHSCPSEESSNLGDGNVRTEEGLGEENSTMNSNSSEAFIMSERGTVSPATSSESTGKKTKHHKGSSGSSESLKENQISETKIIENFFDEENRSSKRAFGEEKRLDLGNSEETNSEDSRQSASDQLKTLKSFAEKSKDSEGDDEDLTLESENRTSPLTPIDNVDTTPIKRKADYRSLSSDQVKPKSVKPNKSRSLNGRM